MEAEIIGNHLLSEPEEKNIKKCISTIAGSYYGSIPYMRGMGLRKIKPDNNSPMEKNEYAAELMEQINEWEWRVDANEVIFESDNNPKVVMEYVGD